MQRRKFLVGLGATVSGSAAAVGTGAFTSVEADRSVDVEVAGDASAYLAITEVSGSPNSDYIDTTGAEVSFNFDSTTPPDGEGFNPNSVTVIEDLAEVQNQGTQSAFLSVDLSDLDVSDGSGNEAAIELAAENTASSPSGDSSNNNIAFDGPATAVGDPTTTEIVDPTDDGAMELGEGEAATLDLTVDTTNFENANVGTSGSVTFIADQSSSL